MKTKSALLALVFAIMVALGFFTNTTSAAVTAMTGVSLTPISLSTAYSGLTPSALNVNSNPGAIFLSFKVSNEGEEFFLNSMTVDISINGVVTSSESYTSYAPISTWSRVGVTLTETYAAGAMNQGGILVGCGTRDETAPYIISLNPGDIWQAKMTYSIQGQSPVTSVGKVVYVPEPGAVMLISLSSLLSLRRKRK